MLANASHNANQDSKSYFFEYDEAIDKILYEYEIFFDKIKHNRLSKIDRNIPSFTKEDFHSLLKRKATGFYYTKNIQKNSSTAINTRRLDIPYDNLKYLQKYILYKIFYDELESFGFEQSVAGFLRGKSIKYNAGHHINKNIIIKIDLQNFFPSINRAFVYSMLLKKFTSDKKIAYLYSKILTYNDYLPQGAPTSPFFS